MSDEGWLNGRDHPEVRIPANLLMSVLAALGAFFLVAPFAASSAYVLFAPPGTRHVFSYQAPNIGVLLVSWLIIAAHVLFLSFTTMWVRHWNSWWDYFARGVLFLGALLISMAAFAGVGLGYSYFSGNTRPFSFLFPVNPCLFGVFLATVAVTLGFRCWRARKTRLEA